MSDQEIKEYIDRLNTQQSNETIFSRRLNKSVEIAKVWEKEPEIDDDFNIKSYRFFFIQNDNRKYVAAVIDMIKDLHWFVLEAERKKGQLTKALREAILPYLFDEGRDSQRITIKKGIGDENYKNSKKVATQLGFKSINEDETIFELSKNDFNWEFENLKEENYQIKPERKKELRKRILFAYRSLMKISDELSMAYDDDKGLEEIARKVSYYDLTIEDIE